MRDKGMKILSIRTEKRKIGDIGERAAAKYLKKKGFRTVERNYVAFNHEIDIIAESRELIIFVEVKTVTVGKEDARKPRPASAVNAEKQRSIISAAKCYLASVGFKKPCRMDVVEVYLKEGSRRVERIEHLEYAFNANTALSDSRKNRFKG